MRAVVVLGGGGAKAIAHAGAWKAINESGAKIVEVVGTSMGAVMGAALAHGTSPDQLLETARALGPKDVATLDRLSLLKGVFAANILKPEALRRTIARLVPATTFDALRLPLTVTATDLDSGELVLFGARARATAPLRDVLYASCALPLYFPPAVIDGRRLADGGLRAVLPLAVAATIPADVVVAVDVGSGFDEQPPPPSTASHRLPPPLLRAHDSAIRILMAAQTERAIEGWPSSAPRLTVVRPVAELGATFAVGQSDRYFAAGYEATKRALRS
ncbi:MAG TPA: patatin-like phospholipase family protein [Gemmatimonadales bacterium]|nr:patatin-like phospholipase family protein [Gemmatimonadales bacterium]